MTKDEILDTPIGQPLSILVQKEIFGLTTDHLPTVYEEGYVEDGSDGWAGFVCPRCKRPHDMLDEPCVKYYSEDICQAWDIVWHMKNNSTEGMPVEIKFYNSQWHVDFGQSVLTEYSHELLPVAICKAALIAKIKGQNQ